MSKISTFVSLCSCAEHLPFILKLLRDSFYCILRACKCQRYPSLDLEYGLEIIEEDPDFPIDALVVEYPCTCTQSRDQP